MNKKLIIGGGAVALIAIMAACGAATGDATSSSATTNQGSAATSPAAGSKPTSAASSISEGVYEVGVDIKAGKYKTAGLEEDSPICYWARLKNDSGEMNAILANDAVPGPTTVTIKKTDKYFKTNGCKPWQKVG